MARPSTKVQIQHDDLEHVPTGITGLDEILNGGLPAGRPTLVCGGPGCGKTLLAMEFLVRGAKLRNEPGVFMSFEETPEELSHNFYSMGIDLQQLEKSKQLFIDYVYVERSEIEETGEYDLEALFIRLGNAIDTIGAKRVVLDTIESLFSGFSNETILRSELRRLFRWLKDKGVTAIITGERGQGQLTRHGLEEYVSDCVILLDHRVEERIANRYIRIVKFRGSKHSDDEYPFLISNKGTSVIPITVLGLDYPVSKEFISSGIPRLDTLLGGRGFYRGSSILVSGTAGSGKTSLAASFIANACRNGEKCLFFAFEESAAQITRNMLSIGINIQPFIDEGILQIHAVRPTQLGIEMHLLTMQQLIEEVQPKIVVVDPITNLLTSAVRSEVKSMIIRLIDFCKKSFISALFTSLTPGEAYEMSTEVNISSLMDTWLFVRYLESNGERNRGIYILKSRGMNHSNQIREFKLTDHGVELMDAYLGTNGILTGSARVTYEANQKIESENSKMELARKRRDLERKQKEISNQIQMLEEAIVSTQEELDFISSGEKLHKQMLSSIETELANSRRADKSSS